MKQLSKYLAAALLLGAAGGAFAGDTLTAQQVLKPGEYLTSKNGLYSLVMQHDGNLVSYFVPGNGQAIARYFRTNTSNGAYVRMQIDGNLALYTSSHTWAWTSKTGGRPHDWAYRLTLGDDGRLAIYGPNNSLVKELNRDTCPREGGPAPLYSTVPAYNPSSCSTFDPGYVQAQCGVEANYLAYDKGRIVGTCPY